MPLSRVSPHSLRSRSGCSVAVPMNNDPKDTSAQQVLTDAAKQITQTASAAATDAAHHAKDALHQANDAARSCCTTVSAKVENGVARAQNCLHRNPLAVILGAVAVGMAVGCLMGLNRRTPTLKERFVEDPLQTTRDTLYAALAPVAQRLHSGYDTARHGAEKALNGHHCSNDSWSNQLGRAGSNLKFW